MKKIFLSAIAIILLGACTQDINDIKQTRQEGDITGSVSAFKFDGEGLTRTSLEYGPDEEGVLKLKFFWAKDDKVAVFGKSGTQQVVLNMSDVKEGQKVAEAKFSITEDYQLAEGQTYVAYYPRINNMSQHADKVAFNYLNQVQDGNTSGSTAHLGKYDYMATKPVVPGANNVADFEFQHQCSPMLIELQNVPAGTYKSLALKAEEDVFTTEGTYNIFSGEITPVGSSSVMTLTYKENIVVGEKGTLYAWMMTAPVDLTGKTLKVVTTDASENTVEYDVPEKYQKEHKAAYYYTIVVNESQEPEGPEYVDLGLPTGTLWATVNVGAENPEDIGNYYAWGETETKTSFTANNYKFYPDGKQTSCNKYFKDGKMSLDDEDDVATATYGSEWRLPTSLEWDELKLNCTWSAETYQTKAVFKLTSKINGKVIYIPSNGYIGGGTNGDTKHDVGDKGYYWCKDKDTDANSGVANSANPCSNSVFNIGTDNRCYGLGARAVRKIKAAPTSVDLGLPSGTLWAVANLGATAIEGGGTSTVSGSGSTGNLYAWGEIEPRTTTYNWANYKWTNGGGTGTTSTVTGTFTKYYTGDNKTQLDLADDAAYQMYGEGWSIPTKADWDELCANCTAKTNTSSTQAEKNSVTFTSKINGKSITLTLVTIKPNATVFRYWSSTLYTSSNKVTETTQKQAYQYVRTPGANSTYKDGTVMSTDRYQGVPIRPVYKKK